VKVLTSPDLLRERSILVCFSTRQGGVSPAPYDTLNVAAHVGDELANVRENRQRLLTALSLDPARLTTAQQTHSRNVVTVDAAGAGTGAFNYETAIPDTDALVTRLIETPIAVFTADCVPVILADPGTRTVAVVHAGYKGLNSKIIASLDKMLLDGGGRRGDIIAFVGPAIGACCYDVDAERAALFSADRLTERAGKIYLDTPGVATDELRAAGVLDDNIKVSGLCTSCRSDLFFSYRREQVCGRQATIAALRQ
jgi:YfiH family protein